MDEPSAIRALGPKFCGHKERDLSTRLAPGEREARDGLARDDPVGLLLVGPAQGAEPQGDPVRWQPEHLGMPREGIVDADPAHAALSLERAAAAASSSPERRRITTRRAAARVTGTPARWASFSANRSKTSHSLRSMVTVARSLGVAILGAWLHNRAESILYLHWSCCSRFHRWRSAVASHRSDP